MGEAYTFVTALYAETLCPVTRFKLFCRSLCQLHYCDYINRLRSRRCEALNKLFCWSNSYRFPQSRRSHRLNPSVNCRAPVSLIFHQISSHPQCDKNGQGSCQNGHCTAVSGFSFVPLHCVAYVCCPSTLDFFYHL